MFGWLFTVFFYFCLVLGLLITIYVLYFFTYETLFQIGWLNVNYIPGLEKKHVFITGCDSGFGFLLACSLDKMGCPVFAACLTKEGQRRVTEKCSSRLKAFLVDVTKIETIKSVYEEISSTLRKTEPEGGRSMTLNTPEFTSEYLLSDESYLNVHEMKFLTIILPLKVH